MTALFLFLILTSAAYYLGAHAKITGFLWRRYPTWLDDFMLCAWCAGTWYGLGVGGYFWLRRISFLGFDPRSIEQVLVCGAAGMILTPAVIGTVFALSEHIPRKAEDDEEILR